MVHDTENADYLGLGQFPNLEFREVGRHPNETAHIKVIFKGGKLHDITNKGEIDAELVKETARERVFIKFAFYT